MFVYQKKLQYPVRIKNTNPKLAAQIISQYGGPECNRLLITYAPFLTKNLSKNNMVFFSVDKFDRNCCKKDRSGCGCRNLGLW